MWAQWKKMEACSCPVIARKRTDAKGERLQSWGHVSRDGVICDDLLIREVQDVFDKMGLPAC